MSELPIPFRDPVPSVRPRRSLDMLKIERRGSLAPAWAGGLVRTRPFFDLKRWVSSRPSWWADYGSSMETPFALPYVATSTMMPTEPVAIERGPWARDRVECLQTWVASLWPSLPSVAMSIAWSRQTGELKDVLRRVGGIPEAEAVKYFIRTVSRLTNTSRILHGILEEWGEAPELAVRGASPSRVDVRAILGVHPRPASTDEEEEPPGTGLVHCARSCTSSVDDDRRRRSCGCGGGGKDMPYGDHSSCQVSVVPIG